MAEERDIRLEDSRGNSYFFHGKAKTTFLENGKSVESELADNAKKISTAQNMADSAKKRADQAFQSASNGKTQIASAITGKGVSANKNDTFNVLANKITSIETSNPAINFIAQGRNINMDRILSSDKDFIYGTYFKYDALGFIKKRFDGTIVVKDSFEISSKEYERILQYSKKGIVKIDTHDNNKIILKIFNENKILLETKILKTSKSYKLDSFYGFTILPNGHSYYGKGHFSRDDTFSLWLYEYDENGTCVNTYPIVDSVQSNSNFRDPMDSNIYNLFDSGIDNILYYKGNTCIYVIDTRYPYSCESEIRINDVLRLLLRK